MSDEPKPADPTLTPLLVHPDARCVRCGYSLRGLTIDHMCPECGTPIWGSFTPQRTSGLAIASLVLGITAIPLCMIYGVPSMVCGITALVLARQADEQIKAGQASPASLGMIKAGRICGRIGIFASLAFWLVLAVIIIGQMWL
ncbi:MAG: hypothetical protein JSV03_12885 [Planctomycetota bacterium]|nr:MAG: hypothetical protein JSV03_12885 [Planctomycetota bacterium]